MISRWHTLQWVRITIVFKAVDLWSSSRIYMYLVNNISVQFILRTCIRYFILEKLLISKLNKLIHRFRFSRNMVLASRSILRICFLEGFMSNNKTLKNFSITTPTFWNLVTILTDINNNFDDRKCLLRSIYMIITWLLIERRHKIKLFGCCSL